MSALFPRVADYANRRIGRSEWMAAREPIRDRIDQARRRLSRLSPTTPSDGYVGQSELLRAAWTGLTPARQKAIVRGLIERVIAPPAKPGAKFEPDRCEPIWRL